MLPTNFTQTRTASENLKQTPPPSRYETQGKRRAWTRCQKKHPKKLYLNAAEASLFFLSSSWPYSQATTCVLVIEL